MATVIGAQFNNYSHHDIQEMMMEYVDGEWDMEVKFAVSHRQFGAVENDVEFTPGVYRVINYFVEVTEDNPKIVWWVNPWNFLTAKGRITGL